MRVRIAPFMPLLTTLVTLFCLGGLAAAHGETAPSSRPAQGTAMNIVIEADSPRVRITATLADTAAARDFYALLPLTLTLEDYAASEKIANLPKKLSTAGAPRSYAGKKGDLTYYAPWGNLAMFYKGEGKGGGDAGLVYLGAIDEGLEQLAELGDITVTIRAAD